MNSTPSLAKLLVFLEQLKRPWSAGTCYKISFLKFPKSFLPNGVIHNCFFKGTRLLRWLKFSCSLEQFKRPWSAGKVFAVERAVVFMSISQGDLFECHHWYLFHELSTAFCALFPCCIFTPPLNMTLASQMEHQKLASTTAYRSRKKCMWITIDFFVTDRLYLCTVS